MHVINLLRINSNNNMPCYGHSHCALCNVPICPDCIGNRSDESEEDEDTTTFPDIVMSDIKHKWLKNMRKEY
jgi:hypothetical protein